jgi:hypothetical protein
MKYTITIIIEKTLEDWWATKKELAAMSDTEIVELLQEDESTFLENATWTVYQEPREDPKVLEALQCIARGLTNGQKARGETAQSIAQTAISSATRKEERQP